MDRLSYYTTVLGHAIVDRFNRLVSEEESQLDAEKFAKDLATIITSWTDTEVETLSHKLLSLYPKEGKDRALFVRAVKKSLIADPELSEYCQTAKIDTCTVCENLALAGLCSIHY